MRKRDHLEDESLQQFPEDYSASNRQAMAGG